MLHSRPLEDRLYRQEFGALGSAQGVDPSAQAVAFCHERGLDGVSQSGLEALPFERDSFDLLMALDVIEHIDADAVALAELGRVAAPGASLLITVPAYGWLWSGHDDTHHHFRRYTLRGLRERVVASGWRPTFATYFNSLLLPPIAAVRLLGRLRDVPARGSDYDRTPPALSPILEAPMRAEARLIARGVRLPAGVSVGMVSVRP